MNPNQVNPQQTNQYTPNVQPSAQPGAAVGGLSLDTGPSRSFPQTPGASTDNSKKGPKSNINSTQNMLEIAEIRDGIVIMNDGSYRSVVMVKPVNFDLMSSQEKQSVEFTYQGFLNALYFPIQIFIHSEKVDLGPYLQRLEKLRSEQDNMLLSMLMADYIQFMSDLSSQTNIMDKKFYLVVPYYPVTNIQNSVTQSKNFFTGLAGLFDTKQKHVTVNETDLQRAKDELKNRVEALITSLQQCGVPGLPLDTQELIELYYNTYNPDTATHQPLHTFDALEAPVVSKGEGFAPQPNLDRESQR